MPRHEPVPPPSGMLVAALRRFALLAGGTALATAAGSLLLGLAAGASIDRSLYLGYPRTRRRRERAHGIRPDSLLRRKPPPPAVGDPGGAGGDTQQLGRVRGS